MSEILRARWPEVAMVTGLQACCIILLQDFQSMQDERLSFERLFLLGIFLAFFGIFSQMLFWGFLRTAVVGGTQSAQPMELLRTGRGYFWKLLVFQLLLFPVFLLVILAVVVGVQIIIYGHLKDQEIPAWLNIISATIAGMILLKPTYFVPAQIIRDDCGIWEAVVRLRQTQLFKMKYFLTAAVGLLVFNGAMDYVFAITEYHGIFYYPILGFQAAVIASGMLILFLAAILDGFGKMPDNVSSDEQTESHTNEL